MASHIWAKVYLELPTDPKLIGRSAHDCYLWVCLILIAKSGDGSVPPWQADAKYLSKYARVSLKEVVAALVYFEDVGMIQPTPNNGWLLTQFQKRQQSADPTAAERKRKSRNGHGDVTACHGDVTRDSHDTRAREEAEGRGLTSPSPKEAEAESLRARSAPNVPRVPFDDGLAMDYAANKGFAQEQIGRMVDKFLDHHAAGGWKRTGGVVIRDRMAAWRTWVANELERNPPVPDYKPLKVVY